MVEDQTVVPGNPVGFILNIVQVYAEAPGRQEDQAAKPRSKHKQDFKRGKTSAAFD